MSIIELVQHAKHITSLYVSHNGNFTDASLEAIAEHCGERLRHLCLYGCEQLTDDGLQHMNKCCHHLEGERDSALHPQSSILTTVLDNFYCNMKSSRLSKIQ